MKQSSGILSPSILMERQMNYSLVSASEHKTLVEAAIKLWTGEDISCLISRLYFPLLYRGMHDSYIWREWQKIENKVTEKVSKLPLEKPFQDKLLCFIKPVGLQILAWVDFHDTRCNFITKLPDEFFWTPQGAIDKKKTAGVLIKDESLDIFNRYKLACMYCLESDIHMLWNKIPENQRKSLYREEDAEDYKQQDLAILWTFDIRGEMAKLDNMIEKRWRKCTAYQYLFEYAAMRGNKAAVEYLWKKLTPKERDESLVKTAGSVANRRDLDICYSQLLHKEYYTDVLCFLLSQMNNKEQLNVFASYPCEVLIEFLDWPWQSFFMETAKHMWTFLPKNLFEFFLEVLTDKVIDGYRDCNYQKIFGEFWQQSPISYKKYVINNCSNGMLLSDLFKIEDKENITLILKDATFAEKEKWIFCEIGRDVCTRVMARKKVNWNLFEFFVSECVSSKEISIELKENFKKRNSWFYSEGQRAENGGNWDRFFQILDNLIQKYDNKRSLEEENISPAKRLQNEQLSTPKE